MIFLLLKVHQRLLTSGEIYNVTPLTVGAVFSCFETCGRWLPRSRHVWPQTLRRKHRRWLQTEHPWTLNVCMCGINKCTTQKSRPTWRWLFLKRRTSDWMVPLSKGSLILAARWPQVLHASPVSLALTQTLTLWRFEELPFFHGPLHGASHLISACRSPQLSVSPPSRSPVSTVPSFWVVFFILFSRGLHLVIFKDIITNAHQLTGTRLNLFINSLWFNSLTLLPWYANSCGQSVTPSFWGLDR